MLHIQQRRLRPVQARLQFQERLQAMLLLIQVVCVGTQPGPRPHDQPTRFGQAAGDKGSGTRVPRMTSA